ncbi:hypothetical protein FCH33_02030 [Serratia fonticola]|uniref:hypothetical protein n=1 Tax=Serratia fonticola TaxID=47917 RepID=UPI00157633E0|nr:hypothetical protein [Serratia fonticola]NTY85555.1 hypothetical protein [Serratia fonticola]NTZ11602.1 hypothetical protein [Serratia fonticola]
MIEKYFETPLGQDEDAHRRLVAVNAALEIAKASVSAPTAYTGANKTSADLGYVKDKIGELADAIQDALELEDDE